ncbi:MAG: ATP-binding protein [Leptolyngbyaceae cyanobacterium bins.59]|nr:ATP-binding protein [Leptolyngbyaceae cyanobacterium bins.59]
MQQSLPVPLRGRLSAVLGPLLHPWSGRLGIAKKIIYGYSLAIGLAVTGATLSMLVSNYHQEKAQEQLEIAYRQEQLVSDLARETLAIRAHPQRLMMILGDSIWFELERSQFLGHVNRLGTLSDEMNTFIAENSNSLVIPASELKRFKQDYQANTRAYKEWTQGIWQKMTPGTVQQQEIFKAQQVLLTALREESFIALEVKYERLTEELNRILKTAQAQRLEATRQVEVSEVLRFRIIVVAMGGTVLIATFLAVLTSRAIARPIEAVTRVANRVTRESNFTLQAPVMTRDEIGTLAIAFNTLIRNVADYTHELEVSRQTLENRVQERTQALQEALEDVQQTQSQLVQAEKMSSLGQLVAGVAHEINNPVNFIHGNLIHAHQYTQDLLDLLALYDRQYPQPGPTIEDKAEEIDLEFLCEDLPKLLRSMQVGADRIREIVQSLRNFSRLDEADIKTVDIHEGINSTLMILQNRLKAKPDRPAIQVIQEYGNLPPVECYAGQLNQVFMNIFTNAIDALEERDGKRSAAENAANPSRITVRTEVVEKQAVIRIIDNGPGMPEEVKRRLFDPFFTTKAVGKGTGLGMSISYQIVTEKHNGSVTCISEPGQGAEFVIVLPLVAPRMRVMQEA